MHPPRMPGDIRLASCLLIIFKVKLVQLDGVAVLDSKLLQLLQDPVVLQEILEEAEALLRLQIRVSEHLVDLRSLHMEQMRILRILPAGK